MARRRKHWGWGFEDEQPSHPEIEGAAASIRDHLAAAASVIDRIAPLEGPPDLAMWVWHLSELKRIAEQMGAP